MMSYRFGVAVDVRVLGTLKVRIDGESQTLGGYKQRSVFAYLLVNSPDWVNPEDIVEAVWGMEAPEGAAGSLQTHIFNLRKILEPDHARGEPWRLLDSSNRGYRLDAAMPVDADEFEMLIEDGSEALNRGRMEDAANLLSKAIDLWEGDPLGDLGGEHWARSYVSRLEELKLEATSKLVETRLALGEHESLVAVLEDLVAKHPLKEGFWAQLMVSLYRSGRQADALRAYQRVTRVLAEELGVEPSRELSELEQRVLEHDPSLDLGAVPRGNIPAPLTRLVGRTSELSQIGDLIEASRLFTITGPPGAGKTRLATEAALDMTQRFPDGTWFVELAPLSKRAQIEAELLGVAGLGNPPDMEFSEILASTLGSKTALFVFDNCEHVLEEVAPVLRPLLAQAPGVRVLATSRRALDIPGEVTLSIPGLPVEVVNGLSEAAMMFVDRAHGVDPFFDVEGREETINELVARLDGIPLAIELAAARLRILDIEDLHERMEDRLATLGTTPDPVEHHRSLRRLLEWSYDLLEPDEQKLYRWLGLFPDGVSLETTEAMVGAAGLSESDTLELLDALVSGSLLVVDRTLHGRRYRMLETIREHALSELRSREEEHAAREAQRKWAQEWAWSNRGDLIGPDAFSALEEGAAEADNLQSILEWEIDNDPSSAVSLATTLSQFWWMSGLRPVESRRGGSACYLIIGGEFMEHALDAAGDELEPKSKARALMALAGLLGIRTGKFDSAVEQLTEAIEICQELGDIKGEAWARYYRNMARSSLAAGAESLDHAENETVGELFEQIGDGYGMALTQLNRGWYPLVEGDWRAALGKLDDLASSRGGEIPFVAAHCSEFIGQAYVQGERPETASRHLYEALVTYRRRIGPHTCLTHALQRVAYQQAALGELEWAAAFLASAENLRRRLSIVMAPYEDLTSWIDLSSLPDEARDEAFAKGGSWSLDEALAEAAIRIGQDPGPLQNVAMSNSST